MRILVADDNEAVRRGIAKILADLPSWQLCGSASDGNEALTKVRELKPDLVLLDLRMPSGNGLDVARAIKKEMPEMKVVLMSQNDATQLLPSALNAGAMACIDKSQLASDISMLLQKIATDPDE
jgi:DNA-binding NarL/FixJ family response regulator